MTESCIDRLKNHRAATSVALLLIVAVGSWFRLADLGLAAWRADEGFFYDLCKMQITPGQIFDKWMEMQGMSGQFPFTAAFTKWFVEFFNLPANHFGVRLPSTLWGIATILVAYGAGREFGGKGFGLALALVLAMNPFHIQVSREAYHYPPMVCGSFLGLWTALWIFNHFGKSEPISRWFFAVSALGFFLLTYSQPSGWPMAALVVGTIVIGLVRDWLKTKKLSPTYWIPLVSNAIISIPLLVAPWGLKQQMQSASAEVKANMLRVFGTGDPFLPALWRAITCYAWGDTAIRGAFTVLVVILGFWVCIRLLRRDKRYLLLLAFLVIGFGVAAASMRSTARPFVPRYIVVLIPLYLCVLVAGLTRAGELLGTLIKSRPCPTSVVPAALMSIAVLLWIWPAYLSTQLEGKPTPYKKINAWVDSNLPRGTPVLVDRWFEPWNEFRVEPSTNVIYTYTIPNEPLDVYIQHRWRDTVMNFFARNPDAAYLEIAKSYWEKPEVGAWQWPRDYFARRVAISNDAALKLRALGQGNREDYYVGNTNRLIVELFYNTREDVLAKARLGGEQFMVFYGDGWGYWKNGPGWNQSPKPDFRDWRLMQGEATMELHNLTDKPGQVWLVLSAVAVQGPKEVEFAGSQKHRFNANQLEQFELGPLQLPSGRTVLKLNDQAWNRAKVPLLVEQASIKGKSSNSSKEPISSQ